MEKFSIIKVIDTTTPHVSRRFVKDVEGFENAVKECDLLNTNPHTKHFVVDYIKDSRQKIGHIDYLPTLHPKPKPMKNYWLNGEFIR